MTRLYRLLLRMYPAGFREEYAPAIERQFRDEYREAETHRARLLLILRALTDLLTTIPAELARELHQDLAYAARIYRKRTAGTLLALGALALAIGTTTGIFSVLNALLIRSLPFKDPAQLVAIKDFPLGSGSGPAKFDAWRTTSPYLADAAHSKLESMNLAIGNQSFRVKVSESTANFLSLLGAEPALGRDFLPDEDLREKSRVAVIGYGLWQQAFGGAHQAIGSTIRLNDIPVTIIGVAPPRFDFPGKAAVWTPTYFASIASRDWAVYQIGRLKPNTTFRNASALFQADFDRTVAGFDNADTIAWYKQHRPTITPLQDSLSGPVGDASLALMAMMLLVLLIACANLAHLLLSRAAERSQELAIRAACGAGRARLTRQLITEAAVLTTTAALAGLAVANWTADLAATAQPSQLALRQYVLDWRVLAFAMGLAALTGIAFGVLPASLLGRLQPGHELIHNQPGSRTSAAARIRGLLIAVQVALTVTLVAGSFSLGRSFLRLLGTDLGYRTGDVVTLSTYFPKDGDAANFSRRALERLRALPGIESAGAASYLPLAESHVQEGTYFQLNANDPKPGDPRASARVMLVTPDYFRTIGTPLLAGREFLESEVGWRTTPQVVIVNDLFARRYPNQPLVGRKLHLTPDGVDATIVGIVASHRFHGPEEDPWEVIYRPLYQYEQWTATFVAKTAGNPENYISAIRRTVQQVNPAIPVYDVKTLDQRLADTLARPRFYTTAILFLSAFALLVAAIGAYGAATQSVTQRTREIGIRLAVGGHPARIRAMIFRQSIAPVLSGAIAGLFAAAALGRFLQHLLASAEPTGAALSTAAALTIAAATSLAVWSATRRIIRTDPTTALRTE